MAGGRTSSPRRRGWPRAGRAEATHGLGALRLAGAEPAAGSPTRRTGPCPGVCPVGLEGPCAICSSGVSGYPEPCGEQDLNTDHHASPDVLPATDARGQDRAYITWRADSKATSNWDSFLAEAKHAPIYTSQGCQAR